MLRIVSKFGKNTQKEAQAMMQKFRQQIIAFHFSSTKTFEEKAQFFERYSNSYVGQDNLEQIEKIKKELEANKYNIDPIKPQIIENLKEIYGKNYDEILNKRFEVEIDGHKDGLVLGEFELFPENIQDHGRFDRNMKKNNGLIHELHSTTYVNINNQETHKYVVQNDSHFSLLLDSYIPDEYVSDLNDNQVCLFGFPKDMNAQDIQTLLKDQFNANYNSIVIGDCVMSLPAYAVLTFNNSTEANTFKDTFNSIQNDKSNLNLYATTFADSRKEHSNHRTLLVAGFRETESFNDLLNFLSSLGSVMHFEMVQEPVHQKLPTTEQVLNYLKTHVKEGDESVIYEITDISDGAPHITEYPPHNPNISLMRDGKRLSEVVDELEAEKIRAELLAKRELTPRIVLQTWDSEKNLPEEYQLKNSTAEQKELMQKIENELRSEYTNKQYLFVTYASLRQAQSAFHILNRTGIYETTLLNSIEHYHCDTAHQASVFKQIKQKKGEIKEKLNDANIQAAEEDKIYSKSHEQMREDLIEQVNGQQFSIELSKQLEKEIIGKTKHGIEQQLHLKNEDNKLGREFNTKIGRNDVNQIASQMQDRQLKHMQSLEQLQASEEQLLNLYRAKVLHNDIHQITNPYINVDPSVQNEIISNAQSSAIHEYKTKQQQFLQEEAIKAKWREDTKEILEKKMAFSRPGRSRSSSNPANPDDIPEIKEKEEEPDQYYVPLNDYIQGKKQKKYMRYVEEMQRLYDGEFSEAMKERIFNRGQEQLDQDGNLFVNEELGKMIDRSMISEAQLEDMKYFESIKDVLPNKRIHQLYNMIQESPDETLHMLNQTKLPTRVFDRNSIPELDENAIPLNNQEFVHELNKYVAELGQVYEVQKDARGDEKIVMYQNTPHPVPIQALNVDEIQLLRDCLATYGFNDADIETEINYFLKHGDYSQKIQDILASEQSVLDQDTELDSLIHATGLSKAELESILKLDLEKDGAKVVKSIQEQREEIAFEIKMGTAQPKDLIKTNTKLRSKDKQGKYKQSAFKFF